MKKLALALCLLSSSAMGQEDNRVPVASDYLKNVLANCTTESANLFEQANRFAAQLKTLQKELDDLRKKQSPEEKK